MAAGRRPDVQIMYRHSDDGRPMRASGIRVTNDLVLTADHCAAGDSHQIMVDGGVSLPSEVAWRSYSPLADLALLRASGLAGDHTQPLALFDRTSTERFECRSACYPAFKKPDIAGATAGLAVPRGTITPAENTSPRHTEEDAVPTLSFTLDAASVLPAGPTVGPDAVQSWQSASGGGVLVEYEGFTYCVGIIVEQDDREDIKSLHVSGFDALARLAPVEQETFWKLVDIAYVSDSTGRIRPDIAMFPAPDLRWLVGIERLRKVGLLDTGGFIRDDTVVQVQLRIVAEMIGMDLTGEVGA